MASIERDSNFFRTSGLEAVTLPGSTLTTEIAVPVQGVTFESGGLVGAFHQVYSRQTVDASATVARVHFQELGQYDYTSENLHLGLQSDLPYNSQLKLAFTRSAQLARFADIGNPQRDIIDSNETDATVSLPLVSNDWQFMVAGTETTSDNSVGSFQALDLRTSEIDAGIHYVPSTGNHIDLLFRDAYAKYPYGSAASYVSPYYRDRGVDLRVDTQVTGASRLAGHAGYLERRNADLIGNVFVLTAQGAIVEQTVSVNRDFSGPGFDLTYTWQVTGASQIQLYGMRQLGAAGDYNYLSAANHLYQLTATYQPAPKYGMSVYASWMERNYFGSYAILTQSAPGTSRIDVSRRAGATLHWNPRDWLQVTLDMYADERVSNIAIWDYYDRTATLSIQGNF